MDSMEEGMCSGNRTFGSSVVWAGVRGIWNPATGPSAHERNASAQQHPTDASASGWCANMMINAFTYMERVALHVWKKSVRASATKLGGINCGVELRGWRVVD